MERNTVWRDMVAMERRTVAATVEGTPSVKKPPWFVQYRDSLSLLLALCVFVTLLSVDTFPVGAEVNLNVLMSLSLAQKMQLSLWLLG